MNSYSQTQVRTYARILMVCVKNHYFKYLLVASKADVKFVNRCIYSE